MAEFGFPVNNRAQLLETGPAAIYKEAVRVSNHQLALAHLFPLQAMDPDVWSTVRVNQNAGYSRGEIYTCPERSEVNS